MHVHLCVSLCASSPVYVKTGRQLAGADSLPPLYGHEDQTEVIDLEASASLTELSHQT